jgi:hypothetical protein
MRAAFSLAARKLASLAAERCSLNTDKDRRACAKALPAQSLGDMAKRPTIFV